MPFFCFISFYLILFYFGGTMQCPLLCKEFIIDAWQIYYARSKDADAILLIATMLPDSDNEAKRELKLTSVLSLCRRC